MALDFGESLSGSELIDALKGAQEMVDPLSRVEYKVAKLKGILQALGVGDLSCKVVDLNAMRAFVRPEQQTATDFERGHLSNVECVGRLGMTGQMFMYLFDEETPIDELSLNVFEPVTLGVDLKELYGDEAVILQFPVRDIMVCQEVRAA